MKTQPTTEELLAGYLEDLGVTMETFPNYDKPEWAKNMNGYTVLIKRGTKEFSTPYFMGRALGKEPELTGVIESLYADRQTVQGNVNFEEWCGDLGYNSDSISDQKTFNACIVNANRLEMMFTEKELSNLGRIFDGDELADYL